MIPREKMIEWSKIVSKYLKECTFKKCIFPNCNVKYSKAHSIQKSKILERIAHNGKVMSYDPRKTYVTGDFEEVGINKASTFFGFCNHHDNSLFLEIEDKDYNGTLEQNFLFAYRTCARQYVERKTALKVYKKILREQKDIQMNSLIHEEINLTNYLIDKLSNQLQKFHGELTKRSSNRDYTILFTNMKKLSYISLIAVSSIIDLRFNIKEEKIHSDVTCPKEFTPLFFNVFPQNNSTFLLLSCFSTDLDVFKDLFTYIDSINTNKLETLYSQIILTQCQNLFVSPSRMEASLSKKIVSNLVNNMIYSMISKRSKHLSSTPPINIFQSLKDDS